MLQDSFLFLCLTALCLPKTRWAADLIRALGEVLEVTDGQIHGALPLLYSPQLHEESMLCHAEKMAASLRSNMTRESAVGGFITIFSIILHGQELAALEKPSKLGKEKRLDPKVVQLLRFDARTSVLLRRLAFLLRIKLSSLSKLEDVAIRQMQQSVMQMRQSENAGEGKNRLVRKQLIRASKICGGAIAAGGMLALTGGMAAPALATGLATLGFASAATFATTAAVAGLLGGAGAGYGAYKMTNRTKGLRHFEFQQISSQRQTEHGNDFSLNDDEMKGMTVYICVSGYLRQAGPVLNDPESIDRTSAVSSMLFSTDATNSPDFYAPWGAEPPVKFNSLLLDRFYSVVAPERRKLVPHLLKRYSGQEETLMNELERLYGIHPKKLAPRQAQPNYYVGDDETKIYSIVLDNGIAAARRTFESTSTGEEPRLEPLPGTAEGMKLFVDSNQPWNCACEDLELDGVGEPPDAIEEPKIVDDDIVKPDSETEGSSMSPSEVRNAPRCLPSKIRDALAVEMEAINLNQCTAKEGVFPDGNDFEHRHNTERPQKDGNTSDDKDEEMEELSVSSTQSLSSSQHSISSTQHSRPSVESSRSEVYWWRESVANHGDQYTVIWEPDNLLAIGKGLQEVIVEGLSRGIIEGLKWTVLSAVVMAVAIPTAIFQFMHTLDDSWCLAIRKADEAGKLLADALMSESHGNRPAVLVGYSVGGRVVGKCLSELAAIATGGAKTNGKDDADPEIPPIEEEFEFLTQRIECDTSLSEKERKRRLRAATIVRDAVIIGAPIDTSPRKWARRRSVVLGRLINVYNNKDWVLALIYRYKRWSVLSLAGLRQIRLPVSIQHELGQVENFNVSDLVDGHGDYPAKMRDILDRVGVGDVSCEEYLSHYFPTGPKASK